MVDVETSMLDLLFYRKRKIVCQHFSPKLKKRFVKLKHEGELKLSECRNISSWYELFKHSICIYILHSEALEDCAKALLSQCF
jgi:hypothetical protein